MKKIAIFSLISLSFFVQNVYSCETPITTNQETLDVINKFGGISVSEGLCTSLRKNKLAISITAYGSNVNGIDVGWAVIKLADSESNITSLHMQIPTSAYAPHREGRPEALWFNAIKLGIEAFDFQKAANQVFELRKKAKTSKS